MAKAVFLHDPGSIYDDRPWERYEFPRMYLSTVEAAVGDWVVYYEPRKAHGGRGALSYFAVARVRGVEARDDVAGRFYARIEPGTFLPLDRLVARVEGGTVMESMLEAAPGRLIRAGATQLAVRRLPDAEFERIVHLGMPESLAEPPGTAATGLAEAPAPFERPIAERLVARPVRDRSFRRRVLEAYEGTCAVSGLSLRNGGGWMEVEAAHVRAVEAGGPDIVQNGIALSATLHKLFDRGLFSISPEGEILVSENKIPRDHQERLFRPDRRLALPRNPADRPHPEFLAWHRRERFGGGDGSGLWRG